MPELIDHGVTGFLVDDVDAAVAAVGAAGTLDRRAIARPPPAVRRRDDGRQVRGPLPRRPRPPFDTGKAEHMINRREFSLGLALAAGAASLVGCTTAPGAAQPDSGSHTSFPSLKQVRAGVLDAGYGEAGPSDGPPVILLHGWPYDIHSYVDVAPLLAASGYRVLVPYLRGYGSTRFLSSATVRNGQQAAVALDVIAFMDALKLPRAVIGGFDWGARTACVIAALWPERCKALVSVSGYLITNLKANLQPLPPAGEYGWWYQYYFATERGVLGYRQNTHDFNRLI